MQLGLEGKRALITGGSAGIGLACARALVGEGVSVAIAGRDRERLAGAAQQLHDLGASEHGAKAPRVLAIAADLSRGDDVERAAREAIEAFGGVDILINSAGSALGGSFLALGDDAYLGAWTLKLLGAIRMVRALAPQMIERRDGRIVNIVGGAGRTPSATFLTGSTTNAALLNFTRGVSKELARHNVRINAISPGTTATERAERLAENEARTSGRPLDEVRRERVATIPLGHAVAPDEIAAMALLLVSDRLPSMTGSEVVIDGGAMPGV